VFEKTAADLAMHADLLDGMGTDPNESVLCVHGGGVYGDKSGTIERWIRQFERSSGQGET
jgi:UV DNA damage repair endonuclease